MKLSAPIRHASPVQVLEVSGYIIPWTKSDTGIFICAIISPHDYDVTL